jgi:hypothetical protein
MSHYFTVHAKAVLLHIYLICIFVVKHHKLLAKFLALYFFFVICIFNHIICIEWLYRVSEYRQVQFASESENLSNFFEWIIICLKNVFTIMFKTAKWVDHDGPWKIFHIVKLAENIVDLLWNSASWL